MGIGKSEADAFYMPAIGYVKKQGNLVYGAGIYGQGGMGTEYANGDMAQVGVGRVVFPLACSVNQRFNIGGSIDVVWAGMDLVVDLNPFNPGKEIDFKDDSDFTGAAKGYSVAAKLGFTYRLNDALTASGVYQTAANLPDLKGDGYTVTGFDKQSTLNFGLSYVPKVSVTAGSGMTIDHSQVNWQLMYSRPADGMNVKGRARDAPGLFYGHGRSQRLLVFSGWPDRFARLRGCFVRSRRARLRLRHGLVGGVVI